MSSDPAYDAVARARNQDKGGNPEGAVRTLEDYLLTDPHNVYARMELARILTYSLKDKRQGLFQLDIILDLDPDNMDALKASVTVKASDKLRTSEADREYEHLVELAEAKGDGAEIASIADSYAVFLRKQAHSYEKAEKYYAKAVEAEPNRYEYHQDYAVFLLNEGRDYVKARHELEEVVRINPDDEPARKALNKLIATKFDSQGNVKLNLLERIKLRKR